MEIVRVVPSGYCMGVVKAIKIVKEACRTYKNTPIYVMGMIVHNRFVVESFNQLGVTTLYGKDRYELIDSIKEGVIIFTAHGTDQKIIDYAADKGLTVINAACDFVRKNMSIITQYINDGYDVLYIGKENHPEAEAALSINPDRIHLIRNLEDAANINVENDRLMVTNQTTMSVYDTGNMINLLKERFPPIIVEEEICDATKARQEAVMKLKDTDLLIVVGDPTSNNTSQLAAIAEVNGVKTVLRIESAADIEDMSFAGYKKIAVTSGASTPRYLTDNVIKYIRTSDRKYLETDISKI